MAGRRGHEQPSWERARAVLGWPVGMPRWLVQVQRTMACTVGWAYSLRLVAFSRYSMFVSDTSTDTTSTALSASPRSRRSRRTHRPRRSCHRDRPARPRPLRANARARRRGADTAALPPRILYPYDSERPKILRSFELSEDLRLQKGVLGSGPSGAKRFWRF